MKPGSEEVFWWVGAAHRSAVPKVGISHGAGKGMRGLVCHQCPGPCLCVCCAGSLSDRGKVTVGLVAEAFALGGHGTRRLLSSPHGALLEGPTCLCPAVGAGREKRRVLQLQ